MAIDEDIGRITDPLLKKLAISLKVDANGRMEQLASGSAGDYPSYRQQVGFIEAIGSVLSRCVEFDKDQYGDRSAKEEN
jgi:hypothetical protein